MEYSEAKRFGLMQYETGRPCKHGHVAPRRTSTRTCVECFKSMHKRWRADPGNRAREQAKSRETKRAHGWYYNEGMRLRQQKYDRKRRGIPVAPYECPDNCESCGRALDKKHKTHLDHDHETGKFRGWLCNRCNLGIGMLGDSIAGLERALAYLTKGRPS